VEEQFYLLTPGLLLFCFWLGKKQGKFFSLILLSGLLLISLTVSQWLLNKDPSAAFYLLPSRAWELLSGALLVFILQRRRSIQLHPLTVQLVGILGLVLIGYSVFFYNKEISFPGFAALLPCLGTTLIIYAGSQSQISWVNYLLQNRLLVFIGLISYSLYLWHWPVLVLYRSPNWMAYDLPTIPVWLLLGFILLISYASWRWIEQPFRKQESKSLSEWRQLGIGLIVLVLCWGLGAAASNKIAGKFQPVPELLRGIQVTAGERCEGIGKDVSLIKSGATNCILGDTSSKPSFFVLGDSHARMWTTGLDVLAKEYQMQGIALSYSSCTPIFEFAPLNYNHCPDAIDTAIDYIINSSTQNVILLGRWSAAVKILNDENTEHGLPIFYTKPSKILKKPTTARKNIYFVYDVPELADRKIPFNKLLESLRNPQDSLYVTIPYAQKFERQQFARGIENLQKKYHFITLDPTQTMLDKTGSMLIIEHSHPIYLDDNHLTDYGSIRFRKVFLPLIQDIIAAQQTAAPENTQPATLQ